MDQFIKIEEVLGNQVVLYKSTTGFLYFYIRFVFFSCFQRFSVSSPDLVHQKQGCIL